MNNFIQYLKAEISKFKEKFCDPELSLGNFVYGHKEFKEKWKSDKHGDYRKIKSNADVFDKVSRFVTIVSRVKEEKDCPIDYEYWMKCNLHEAITALSKMANCFDNPQCNFEELSNKEVDDIFENLINAVESMEHLILLRQMKD